jgi:hypothetical protein
MENLIILTLHALSVSIHTLTTTTILWELLVGAGIHIANRIKGSGKINSIVQGEMNAFLGKAHHTIWTSMPSYNIDKVPDAYKKEHVWKHKINTKLIPNVAPTNPDHPFTLMYFNLLIRVTWRIAPMMVDIDHDM